MNRRVPNGTHGGVRGRELITPSYSISKSLLSDAAKLSRFRNSAGLCTALMPWRADRGKKWGGRRKGCRRFF